MAEIPALFLFAPGAHTASNVAPTAPPTPNAYLKLQPPPAPQANTRLTRGLPVLLLPQVLSSVAHPPLLLVVRRGRYLMHRGLVVILVLVLMFVRLLVRMGCVKQASTSKQMPV